MLIVHFHVHSLKKNRLRCRCNVRVRCGVGPGTCARGIWFIEPFAAFTASAAPCGPERVCARCQCRPSQFWRPAATTPHNCANTIQKGRARAEHCLSCWGCCCQKAYVDSISWQQRTQCGVTCTAAAHARRPGTGVPAGSRWGSDAGDAPDRRGGASAGGDGWEFHHSATSGGELCRICVSADCRADQVEVRPSVSHGAANTDARFTCAYSHVGSTPAVLKLLSHCCLTQSTCAEQNYSNQPKNL